jgi:hypothetical protein
LVGPGGTIGGLPRPLILGQADAAMYAAKRAGLRFAVYDRRRH